MTLFYVLVARVCRFGYKYVGKPLLFRFPPEMAHNLIIALARFYGWCHLHQLGRFLFARTHRSLRQNLRGKVFPNPVGLAAGFDKDARVFRVMPSVGFGFVEVGSITGEASSGNSGTRLWRLPKSKSIQVNYGLANDGVEAVARRLERGALSVPLGTNIASTNAREYGEVRPAIADYVKSFRRLSAVGDYFVVNISCPNIAKADLFWDPAVLEQLLVALDKIKTNKLVFLKVSADMPTVLLDQLVAVAREHRIDGFVCTNLTKDSRQLRAHGATSPVGGLSGGPVRGMSDRLIRHLYLKYGHEFIIVGSGGVFSAADAYRKIKLGATLVQVMTGLIYEGPQLVSEINLGLIKLLKQDGYDSVAQAIGRHSS